MMICTKLVSFPTRERGLKPEIQWNIEEAKAVVPYAGTWIETLGFPPFALLWLGRSLRGNVD